MGIKLDINDKNVILAFDDSFTQVSHIVFMTDAPVTDFRYLSVMSAKHVDWDHDHFFAFEEIYHLATFTPDKPFVVNYMGIGLLPHRAISFSDVDGTQRVLGISENHGFPDEGPETLMFFSDIKLAQVGDTGQAGGLIFYDKGIYSDGWRYLEVAPVSYEFSATWGEHGQVVSGTQTAIGTGKRNTELVVEKLSMLGTANPGAAQMSRALVINEYDDWFLPSKDELMEIYKTISSHSQASFLDDAYYWSSTQESYMLCWGQHFGTGNQTYNLAPNMVLRVRAIRAF
jgi:hypothetical protein